jgi:hypothetical protein
MLSFPDIATSALQVSGTSTEKEYIPQYLIVL